MDLLYLIRLKNAIYRLANPDIAFPVDKRYILNPEKLNQQRLKCATQMVGGIKYKMNVGWVEA
jgi:hypothetical protein